MSKIEKAKHIRCKGFTLVEMIVVLAVVVIMIIPIMGMMDTNSQVIRLSGKKIEAKTLAIMISDAFARELQYAKDVQIDTGVAAMSYMESPVLDRTVTNPPEDLRVHRYDAVAATFTPKEIVGQKMIDQFRVETRFQINAANSQVLDLKIFILEDKNHDGFFNEEAYVYDTSIWPMNIAAKTGGTGSIGGAPGVVGHTLYYKVP